MGEIVRLQKYISMAGAASRRAAETLIADGKVKVNGSTVRGMGTKVEIGADTVELNGEILKVADKKYYILLNKPAGYVTTVKDQFDRKTVIDLVSQDIKARLVPVGRLDYETEGLLLMTNDGDFVYRVSHPKFNTSKTYYVEIKGGITVSALRRLRRPFLMDGKQTRPAEVELVDSEKGFTAFNVTIHEGKNRQIRRMFEEVGLKVAYLKRIKIGNVELGNVPVGRWRYLTSHEINYLMNS